MSDDMVGALVAAAVVVPVASVSVVFGGIPLIVWSSALFVTAVAAGLGVAQSRR